MVTFGNIGRDITLPAWDLFLFGEEDLKKYIKICRYLDINKSFQSYNAWMYDTFIVLVCLFVCFFSLQNHFFLSSLMLPSPCTASSQAFPVNAFRWHETNGSKPRSDHMIQNASATRNYEA